MAPTFVKMVTTVAVLFLAAPAIIAAPADGRSCALCWETAQNQVHAPACTGFTAGIIADACLCAEGNQEIFATCEAQCAGLPSAPSAVCASVAKRDARTCELCYETAQNQAHAPVCTGIFDDASLDSCLCAPGNKEIFDTCEAQCAGSLRAPSNVCAAPAKRDARTCALCYETATNQAHAPFCTGLNELDTEACLCAEGNRMIFDNCNAQCAGLPEKMPENVCPNLAARDSQNPGWGPCGPVKYTSCNTSD